MKFASRTWYAGDPTQEVFIALRDLLSLNPSAACFGTETLSGVLFVEHYLSYSAAAHEVEYALKALRTEGEIVS